MEPALLLYSKYSHKMNVQRSVTLLMFFPPKIFFQFFSCLLCIYTNHKGGNLVKKYQTIKFEAVRERQATKLYTQISRTD